MSTARWIFAIILVVLIVLLIAYARGPKGRDDRVTDNQRWTTGYSRVG